MFEQHGQAVGLYMHPSHWIEKICRVSPGKWVVDIRGNTASRLQIAADAMYTLVNCRTLPAAGAGAGANAAYLHQSSFQSDCASWSQYSDADADASALLKIERGHQFFNMVSNGNHFLVPAILIINALFGPIRITMRYLLEPMGLDYLCVPMLDCAKPGACFSDSSSKASRHDSALLSWAHCFPSARIAWDSVLQYAIEGCVGIKLPKATLTGTCYGYHVGNRTIVTRFLLSNLVATEAPCSLAPLHPTSFQCAGHNTRKTVRIPDFLATPTSDLEWSIISVLFESATQRPKKNSVSKRPIVDFLLRKCGSDDSWRVAGESLNLAPERWLVLWQRTGVWSALTEELTRLRRP